jgi:hypothetical protein
MTRTQGLDFSSVDSNYKSTDEQPHQPSAAELEYLARKSRIDHIEAQANREFQQEQKRAAAKAKSQAGLDGITQIRARDAEFLSEKVDAFKDIATKGFLLVAAGVAVLSFGGIAVGAGALVAGAWGGALTAVGTTLANGAFWAGIGQAGSAVAAAAVGTYAWRGITGYSQGQQALKDREMGIETVEQVKVRLRAEAEGIALKAQPSAGGSAEANNEMAVLRQEVETLRAEIAEKRRKTPVTSGSTRAPANDDNTYSVALQASHTPQGVFARYFATQEPEIAPDGRKTYTLTEGQEAVAALNNDFSGTGWDQIYFGEKATEEEIVLGVENYSKAFDDSLNATPHESSEDDKLRALGEALSKTVPVLQQEGAETPIFRGAVGRAMLAKTSEFCSNAGLEGDAQEIAARAIAAYNEQQQSAAIEAMQSLAFSAKAR